MPFPRLGKKKRQESNDFLSSDERRRIHRALKKETKLKKKVERWTRRRALIGSVATPAEQWNSATSSFPYSFVCSGTFFFIFFALCLTRLAVYIFSLSPFSPFFLVIQFDPFSGDEEEEKFRSCTSIVVGRGEGDEQQQRRRLCFYQLMFFYCI